MEKKNIALKLSAGVLGAGLIAATIVGAVAHNNVSDNLADVQAKLDIELAKEPIVVEKIINNTIEVEVEKLVEVEKIIEVNKTVEVLVDNDKLDFLLNYIMEEDGDLSDIDASELKDDEKDKILDRIVLISDAKSTAINFIKAELFEEIDGEVVDGTTLDEDSVYKLRIDDNFDEISISNIDFDDSDMDVTVTGTFKQDSDVFEFEAQIEIDNGDADDLNIVSIVKRV